MAKKNILFLLLLSLTAFAQKQKAWLDAGNEPDDVYAIIRLLWVG